MNKQLSKYFFYYPVTFFKGERVRKYIPEYEKFQYRSKEEIERYQIEKFKKLLVDAYQKSSYYREIFDNLDMHVNDINTLSDIKKLPLLTKTDVINRRKNIITDNKFLFMSNKTTGGSTGQAVTILKNSDALARERAATWRSYNWAGVSVGDPQARFWGTPLYMDQKLKYKVIDFIANRKRFSAFDINEERLEKFYRQVSKFKPTYLYGYVSIIEIFSRYLKANSLLLPSCTKSVITTSEVLSNSARSSIEQALGIKVYNEYGCGEVGSIAHECEHGQMHVMDDNLILEVISDDNSGAGEIVVTDLYNYAMPLIRYRLGDYASISNERCACGRSLTVIGGIHGRAYDCIVTEDEKLFHPEFVMYIFEALKDRVGGINQFQVIQKTHNLLNVKIVKGDGYLLENENYIAKEINNKLNPNIKITFEYVNAISREASGKLRLIKSEL